MESAFSIFVWSLGIECKTVALACSRSGQNKGRIKWKGWVSNSLNSPVDCELVVTDLRNMKSVAGERITESSDESFLRELASAPLCFRLTPTPSSPVPFFISSDQELRGIRYRAIVKMSVNRLIELPDVADYIESINLSMGRTLEDIKSLGMGNIFGTSPEEHDGVGRLDQICIAAQTARISEGLRLPISFAARGKRCCGVLEIKNDIGRGIFACNIYSSNDRIKIVPGTDLVRTVNNVFSDELLVRPVKIAEVVEILETDNGR